MQWEQKLGQILSLVSTTHAQAIIDIEKPPPSDWTIVFIDLFGNQPFQTWVEKDIFKLLRQWELKWHPDKNLLNPYATQWIQHLHSIREFLTWLRSHPLSFSMQSQTEVKRMNQNIGDIQHSLNKVESSLTDLNNSIYKLTKDHEVMFSQRVVSFCNVQRKWKRRKRVKKICYTPRRRMKPLILDP